MSLSIRLEVLWLVLYQMAIVEDSSTFVLVIPFQSTWGVPLEAGRPDYSRTTWS